MGRNAVVGLFLGAVAFAVAIALLAGNRPASSSRGSELPLKASASAPNPTSLTTESTAADITVGGEAPARSAPEQKTSMDDVHYIPPIGSREALDLMTDEKSIVLGRLEKQITMKTGRLINVPMAWAYREKDGDLTICGAYSGPEAEPIVFVYNSGSRGADPALYLNVDEATYSSFGCHDQSALHLVGISNG